MTQQEANQITQFIQGLVGGGEKATEVSDAHCSEHGIIMEKRWSEKKQKNYLAHNSEDGQICFGKGYLAKG